MSISESIPQVIIIVSLLFLLYLLFFRQEKIAEIKVEKIAEIKVDANLATESNPGDLEEIVKKEDGKFTDWNEWGNCDKSCGGGIKERKRIYIPAKFGGIELEDRDSVLERITCNEQGCPEDGKFTEWNNWSDCDKDCGGGLKERQRIYIPAKFGGVDLSLDERNNIRDVGVCNEQECPANGSFTAWGSWSACNKSCGGGTQTRNRTYTPAKFGGADLADRNNIIESQACNSQSCLVPYTIVLKASSNTQKPVSVTSPNGLYRFDWNGGQYLYIYEKNTSGNWNIVASINAIRYVSSGYLVNESGEFYLYNNSTFTSSSYISITPALNGIIINVAINNEGHLIFVNTSGDTLRTILVPGTYLTV